MDHDRLVRDIAGHARAGQKLNVLRGADGAGDAAVDHDAGHVDLAFHFPGLGNHERSALVSAAAHVALQVPVNAQHPRENDIAFADRAPADEAVKVVGLRSSNHGTPGFFRVASLTIYTSVCALALTDVTPASSPGPASHVLAFS